MFLQLVQSAIPLRTYSALRERLSALLAVVDSEGTAVADSLLRAVVKQAACIRHCPEVPVVD
jgi:hypothetical protein